MAGARRFLFRSPGTLSKFLKYCHIPPESFASPSSSKPQTSARLPRLRYTQPACFWCFCFFPQKVSQSCPRDVFPFGGRSPTALFPPLSRSSALPLATTHSQRFAERPSAMGINQSTPARSMAVPVPPSGSCSALLSLRGHSCRNLGPLSKRTTAEPQQFLPNSR